MSEGEDTKRREAVWGVFKAMHDGDHLKAQEIMASGGWCAPSTADWTIADGTSIDFSVGMIDLSKLQVKRGGITYP